jgi:hypothetical protein
VTPDQPGQIPVAADPQAFARAMMERQQAPQRWQCALCLGQRRAWEEANRPALEAAQAQMMAAAAAGQAPDPRQFLGEHLMASMPGVQEAVTMATIPNLGPCLVCPAHVPPSGAPRRPLLVAAAGMGMAAAGNGR